MLIQSDYAEALNGLAWGRVNCPVAVFQNRDKAIVEATKACQLTNWKNYEYINTLAAAYSQIGDFVNAVKWQKQAISLLSESKLQNKYYEVYLKLYQSKVAYGKVSSGGDLLSWWKLDEVQNNTVIDSSAQDLTGKLIGDAKIVSDPQRGYVLSLDGDGDYVDCGNNPVFEINGSITVSCWIKIAKFDKEWQAIVTKGDFTWRLQRNKNERTLEFACRGLDVEGSLYGSLFGYTAVDDDRWHHVAGVYDGTKLCLYVDGVLDNSVAASGLIDLYDDPIMIGENALLRDPRGYPSRSWKGLIDDVRIYNYALSETDIKTLNENKEPPRNIVDYEAMLRVDYEATLRVDLAIENNSFEQPDVGKIKGWNGEGIDNTPAVDIPGWASDGQVTDSGVEITSLKGGSKPTDGKYYAFLMNTDPAVWQMTGVTITAGEIYKLQADMWATLNADSLRMSIFYNDEGTKVVLASSLIPLSEAPILGIVRLSADAGHTAVGKKLGIMFSNVSNTYETSWAGVDNVHLSRVLAEVVAPKNEAIDINLDEDLIWTVMDNMKVDLYFGPENEPNLLTKTPYKRLSQANATTWDTGKLENNTTYYWRLDVYEPNLPNGDILHKNPVWRFTTAGKNQ